MDKEWGITICDPDILLGVERKLTVEDGYILGPSDENCPTSIHAIVWSFPMDCLNVYA